MPELYLLAAFLFAAINPGAYDSLVLDKVWAKGLVNIASPVQGSTIENHLLFVLNLRLKEFFGGNMYVTPMRFANDVNPLRVNKDPVPITCPQDLWCSFDRPCRWHHSDAVDLRFVNVSSGLPDKELLEVITGTQLLPESPYAVTAGTTNNVAAMLVSDPIPYLIGDGFVYFKYWSSPVVELRVCVKRFNEVQPIGCSQPFSSRIGGERGNLWTIPYKITFPFEIFFQVSNFSLPEVDVGILFLDDIRYYTSDFAECNETEKVLPTTEPPINATLPWRFHQHINEEKRERRIYHEETKKQSSIASLPPLFPCDSNPNSKRSISKNSLRFQGTDDLMMCQAISCSFDNLDSCHYNRQTELPSNLRFFRTVVGPFKFIPNGISRTDKSSDLAGFYLAEGTKVDSTPLVAISSCFSTIYPKNVTFYRWQNSPKSSLKICFSHLLNCVKTFDTVTDGWEQEEIQLSPEDMGVENSTASLIFVAEHLDPDAYIAIDQIGIIDECTE